MQFGDDLGHSSEQASQTIGAGSLRPVGAINQSLKIEEEY